MKSHIKILIAFLLNLFFSLFEFFGGLFTGSIAIISDAIHDLGDAVSIGISFLLERKSKRGADEKYTYGYGNYSVLGAVITSVILIVGGVAVIVRAIERIINPVAINYDGMIAFAIFGAITNFAAAYFTRDGESINQRAVSLHMLEDVLGWIAVLVGAVIIKFTGLNIIDPIISIAVSLFITVNAFKLIKESLDVLLVKAPENIDRNKLIEDIETVEGVEGVHHLHLWCVDTGKILATMHVVKSRSDSHEIKHDIRHKCESAGIKHVTIELEEIGEECHEKNCFLENERECAHHHHNHHHHS